jgi:hypothetical protein
LGKTQWDIAPWFWDFGNGDIGNQGVHEIDLARWAIGTDQFPRSVQSIGGRFGYIDDGETPNTMVSTFDYGPDQPKLIMEVRGLPTKPYHTNGVENVVECENGFLVSPSYTKAVAYDGDGNVLHTFEGGGDANHFNNFLSVVRSRNMKDLHAPAIEAHQSCALLHMANISYRLGTSTADGQGLYQSGAMMILEGHRMFEHLRANQVSLPDFGVTIGARLDFDPRKERFNQNALANRMMERQYRAPFNVPVA